MPKQATPLCTTIPQNDTGEHKKGGHPPLLAHLKPAFAQKGKIVDMKVHHKGQQGG